MRIGGNLGILRGILVERIPVGKGLGGGDAGGWNYNNTGKLWEIRQGVDVFAVVEAEDSAAEQEQGHVGADIGGECEPLGRRK